MRRIIINNPKEYILNKKTLDQVKQEIQRRELLRGADVSRSWPGVKPVRVTFGDLVRNNASYQATSDKRRKIG